MSAEPTAAKTPAGRILVVDDEADLLDLLAENLRRAGYAVDTAADGGAAKEALAKNRYDVVLSDIVMPGMNGLELLRRVREQDFDLPVLLMTGSPGLDTAVQALEEGALKYLVKPVHDDELRQAVERAVHLGRIARLKREALIHLGFDDRHLGDRAGLEIALGRAFGSLWMAYQPIVVARSGQLFGYEALVRSSERTLGVPTALFDAAERLGRVRQLGRAIRDEVAKSLPTMATDIFVNLHGQELGDDSLYAASSLLNSRARQIVLEITERESLEGIPDLRARIATLRRMGFRIAVDDLGAGYAGLTSFAALEPDIVKLDSALTNGVENQPLKRNLIGSMVGLCKSLGILVVAEGIETEGDRDVVVDLGCDLLQGFLLGRPARLELGA